MDFYRALGRIGLCVIVLRAKLNVIEPPQNVYKLCKHNLITT
jgi:hypothetical protein